MVGPGKRRVWCRKRRHQALRRRGADPEVWEKASAPRLTWEVKRAILYCYKIPLKLYRQQFWDIKRLEEKRPWILAQVLRDTLEQWVQPHGKLVQEILEIFMLEQFVDALEEETCWWIRKHQPQDMKQGLQLVESFSAAEKVTPRGQSSRLVGTTKRVESRKNSPCFGKLASQRGVICFGCGSVGHISWKCPKKRIEQWRWGSELDMERHKHREQEHKEQMDCSFGWLHQGLKTLKPMEQIKVGSTLVPTLFNSGYIQTMIWEGIIDSQEGEPDSSINMVCIHGESYTYPRRRLQLTVINGMEEISVGFTRTLPCPMLVGWDWPYFYEALNQTWGKEELSGNRQGEDIEDGQGKEGYDPWERKGISSPWP